MCLKNPEMITYLIDSCRINLLWIYIESNLNMHNYVLLHYPRLVQ